MRTLAIFAVTCFTALSISMHAFGLDWNCYWETPDICTMVVESCPTLSSSCYLKHKDHKFEYKFEIEGSPYCDFEETFLQALNEYRFTCDLVVSENQNVPEITIYWHDTAEDPPVDEGACAKYKEINDGDIVKLEIHFYSHFIQYDNMYHWSASSTCPEVAPVRCLYWGCLHEIGHAIGFRHPAMYSETVMYGCYNSLTSCDIWCANLLYPSDPASRTRYFLPVLENPGVRISWQTHYEYETEAFELLRQTDGDGKFEPVGDLRLPVGGQFEEGNYEVFDPQGSEGDRYRLVEIDASGGERIIAGADVAQAEPRKNKRGISHNDIQKMKCDIDTLLQRRSGSSDLLAAPASGPVEWVAIYLDAFTSAIAPLITHRYSQGLEATGITTEDVTATYGDVPSYLEHLWESQGKNLEYVLLVGNGDIIPFGLCNDGWVGDYNAYYLTDMITADLEGDWRPEVNIGRIPAATDTEVTIYVAKLLDYESLPAQSWNDHVTFLVEDLNNEVASGDLAGHLATSLVDHIPASHVVHYLNAAACLNENLEPCSGIDRSEKAIAEFDEGRETIVALGSISQGCDLVRWLRLYSPSYFCGDDLAVNHRPAFVIGASCDLAYATLSPTVYRELLFAPYCGAIAFFGPESSTRQYANYHISASILDHIYTFGSPSIGHACLQAQSDEMNHERASYAHVARSYILYGDPAISLKGSVSGNPPAASVEYPDGGEYFETPNVIHIAWTVVDDDLEDVSCTVHINYNGVIGEWIVLATDVGVDPNGSGSYDYRVPSGTLLHEHCRIRVLASDACNNQGTDMSNGDFTIQLKTKPSGEPVPVDPDFMSIPEVDYLGSPYPNPFNPNTTIRFGLMKPSRVNLTVFNVQGAVIRSLISNEHLRAGEYSIAWNGTNDSGRIVASGIYFLRMQFDRFSKTRRMLLLR